jgi:AcrR family transcriptional regulator
MTTKSERTAARIFQQAIALFERDGYEATTTAAIAAAAGVSEMTFFRHFATKDALLLDDPYDPVIAAGIAAQPRDLPPLARAIAGVRGAWTEVPLEAGDLMRRRLSIAATPALRGAVARNTLETERVVAEQLVADGADPAGARVAAAALLAAMMAALLDWAASADDRTMGSALEQALTVLEGAS